MGAREFTKSGAFVVTVFALVVLLVPFGIEQIGEATDFFKFPVTNTIKGWFDLSPGRPLPAAAVRAVNWERYRQDLEEFSEWAEGQSGVAISLSPSDVPEIRVNENDEKPVRRIWPVSVTSCTAGDPVSGRKGYIYISGYGKPYDEGSVMAPSEDLCGYEIVFIGERSVWFRAVLDDEGDSRMGVVRFPEFTRVEGDCLVRGNRRYNARDAFPLKSGGWLMIDSFMPPDGTVFKILDEKKSVISTLLCVVIGEKGGR